MTEENTKINEIQEEDVPLDEAGIGEDKPQLEAKKVLIEKYEIRDINKNDKVVGRKLVLIVKHPEREDDIEISGVKYEFQGKIKTSGLWINRDNEGKISYNSAVGNLLRYFSKKSIKELKGLQVNTALDESNYLVVKAY